MECTTRILIRISATKGYQECSNLHVSFASLPFPRCIIHATLFHQSVRRITRHLFISTYVSQGLDFRVSLLQIETLLLQHTTGWISVLAVYLDDKRAETVERSPRCTSTLNLLTNRPGHWLEIIICSAEPIRTTTIFRTKRNVDHKAIYFIYIYMCIYI